MKPRKEDETDADYIARLEASNKGKSEALEGYRKAYRKIIPTLEHSASYTGQVLQTAAEITGMAEDPQVIACVEALAQLATIGWSRDEDVVTVPTLPNFPPADGGRFGGDAEMILLSAVERVKQAREPWGDLSDVIPKLKGLDLSNLDWEGLGHEIRNVLADLEMSRGMLRLDLRSTMYDHCFDRLVQVVSEADRRLHPTREVDRAPF